jgi:GAF domain-containing protein
MDTETPTGSLPSGWSVPLAIDLQANTMQTVLRALAGLAVDMVDAAESASVTLLTGDRPTTVASTGPLAEALDETQYEHGYGPCLDAALAQQTIEISDMRLETRWPTFTAVAVERGVLASLSLPIPVGESITAALNVYGVRADAFAAADRRALQDFVGFGAAAIANMHLYESSRSLLDHMRVAAQSRAVIDQARGILMAEHRCGPDEAFDILRRKSQHSNRKIRDLAEEIVERTAGGASDLQYAD